MKEVLKAFLTAWYALLMMVFILGTAVAFLTFVNGLFDDSPPNSAWAGALGVAVFGYAVWHYGSKFIERMEEIHGSKNDWDDD
jgi:drug/metabolite transporter (DMT)-like permease